MMHFEQLKKRNVLIYTQQPLLFSAILAESFSLLGMAQQFDFQWSGALRALLGRFPSLEDEPQLGALLQAQVHHLLSAGVVRRKLRFG